MKIYQAGLKALQLSLLIFLCGCRNNGPKFVFGPTKNNETSISLKTITKKQTKTDKKPEEMNKRELMDYIKNIEDKSTSNDESPKLTKVPAKVNEHSVSFNVKNVSGQTLYTTCFVHLQKYSYSSWRWDKTDIYRLNPDEIATIAIDSVHSKEALNGCFGYLGIFETAEEAASSTYQLAQDRNILDLDLLSKINGKTVNIEIKNYGSSVSSFDYKISGEQIKQLGFQPELDFFVENQTGKPIFVTCYIYEQNDDASPDSPWEYTKTPVQRLDPGELGIIDVASTKDSYEAAFVRGTLGIFNQDEQLEAEETNFQLLPDNKTIKLDRLRALSGKKIVLNTEKYGAQGDFIDFVVKTQPRRVPGATVGQ